MGLFIEKSEKAVISSEGPDKIYCCEGCGCYGLYTEFLADTRFCSVGCKKIVIARNEIKKKRMDDKMRELRLRRKRRKIKILAQRARKGALIPNNKEQSIEKVFSLVCFVEKKSLQTLRAYKLQIKLQK